MPCLLFILFCFGNISIPICFFFGLSDCCSTVFFKLSGTASISLDPSSRADFAETGGSKKIQMCHPCPPPDFSKYGLKPNDESLLNISFAASKGLTNASACPLPSKSKHNHLVLPLLSGVYAPTLNHPETNPFFLNNLVLTFDALPPFKCVFKRSGSLSPAVIGSGLLLPLVFPAATSCRMKKYLISSSTAFSGTNWFIVQLHYREKIKMFFFCPLLVSLHNLKHPIYPQL